MWPTPGSPPTSLRGSRVRLRPARRSRHPPLVHPPRRGRGPPSPREKADQMDAMHEKGVKAFPAKTEGQGNQLGRRAVHHPAAGQAR
jgi:hypothetical protein